MDRNRNRTRVSLNLLVVPLVTLSPRRNGDVFDKRLLFYDFDLYLVRVHATLLEAVSGIVEEDVGLLGELFQPVRVPLEGGSILQPQPVEGLSVLRADSVSSSDGSEP